MKNKKVLKICITILVILVIAGGIVFSIKPVKAFILYGNDVCEGEDEPTISLSVMARYKCELCNKTKQWSTGNTPEICPECAEITNRCKWCGKKLN